MKKAIIVITLSFLIASPALAQSPFQNVTDSVQKIIDRPAERSVESNSAPDATTPRRVQQGSTGAGNAGSQGNITLPYCESADIDHHYELATEYVNRNESEYSVVRSSNRQVGPCNEGNTAWTAFNVVDEEGELEGVAVVNGDTEEVTLRESDDLPVSEPVRDRIRTPSEENEEPRKRESLSPVRDVQNRVKSFLDRTILKRGTGTPVGPGAFRPADEANVPEEVREMLEQKREEVRERIREHAQEVEQIREEVRERVQEKRAEIEEKLQEIRNERRREAAERVHENLFQVRERVLENFNDTLDRLNTVLGNVTTRADKAENQGANVDAVRTAIQNATNQIEQARERVKETFRKEYEVTITGEEELRENFTTFRNQLRNDLSDVRNIVRSAHEATRSAADTLTQVIEDLNLETESE